MSQSRPVISASGTESTEAIVTPKAKPGEGGGSADALSAHPASTWQASWILWRREMMVFFRQRGRLSSALLTPALFWLMLGSGLNQTFTEAVGYRAYFFPGTIVMIIMFTAIFSAYSVIDDRKDGFLQGVLVAPISRLAIVLGKVLGGATIATIQGLVFVALWPAMGYWPGWWSMAAAAGMIFVLAATLMVIGFVLAWPMESTAGFHAVLNLILFPMWFLSGAVFPYDQTPSWLQWMMVVNPLTYGQTALAASLHGNSTVAVGPVEPVLSALIMVAVSVALLMFAARVVAKPRKDGL